MLKPFTEDTGKGDWPIVCLLGLIPFFEERGCIGFFPDGRGLSCINGFLIYQL